MEYEFTDPDAPSDEAPNEPDVKNDPVPEPAPDEETLPGLEPRDA